MRCWGENYFGELGYPTSSNVFAPSSSNVLSGAYDVGAGNSHTCALLNETWNVSCWGNNGNGQLGTGVRLDLSVPPSRGVLSGVAQIAVGSIHTCALMQGTGGVRCWGSNHNGQLGVGNTTDLFTPPANDVLVGAIQVAAGDQHTCALMGSDGGVMCWGLNSYGQLGRGDLNSIYAPPSETIMTAVAKISTGGYHTCALVYATGGVRCWGYNRFGQLGVGSMSNLLVPPHSDVLTGVLDISAGDTHTCAIMVASRGLRCWGSNTYGQLGVGMAISLLLSPTSFDIVVDCARVATGSFHTCALTEGGDVQCWGYNNYGQLGIGNTTNLFAPSPYILF